MIFSCATPFQHLHSFPLWNWTFISSQPGRVIYCPNCIPFNLTLRHDRLPLHIQLNPNRRRNFSTITTWTTGTPLQSSQELLYQITFRRKNTSNSCFLYSEQRPILNECSELFIGCWENSMHLMKPRASSSVQLLMLFPYGNRNGN